jgi:transcription termination factor NusB
VLLAGELSTDDSGAFVNGLLARVLELKRELAARRAAGPAGK